MRTLVILFFGLMGGDAWAWRCNGWIIDPPQSLFEVTQKCGEPQASESRTEWWPMDTTQQRCDSLSILPPTTGMSLLDMNPQPAMSFPSGSSCSTGTVPLVVPFERTILYYDDNVPKALHFQNGRLRWIEDLWGLRH